MTLSKWRWIGVVLLALAVLAAIAFLAGGKADRSLARRLADGTTLRIVGISYGTNHSFTEPTPKPWQLAIGAKLPYALASRLGWWFGGGNDTSISNPFGLSNLVLFLVHEGPGTARPAKSYRLVVFDDQGNAFENFSGGGSSGSANVRRHFHVLQSKVIDAYPRRGKTIGLRFLSDPKDGKTMTVAEFHIPNPHQGPFPTWAPASLPATSSRSVCN